MASSRVALFACVNSHEGVWTRARGNEVGVEIINLEEEELVLVDITRRTGETVTLEFTQPGQHFLDFSDVERYRVGKRGNKIGTHVKVMLG